MIKKIILLLLLIFNMTIFTSCTKDKDPQEELVDAVDFFNVISLETDALKGEKLEIALYEKELKIQDQYNPYDYNQIKVMFDVTSPSGKVYSIPAFWYQGYTVTFNTLSQGSPSGISGVASTSKDEPQGTEMISALGDPHYRVRLTPEEAGIYKYVINVYVDNKLVSTEHESAFEVVNTANTCKGVLKVSDNKHTLEFTNTNEIFIGVGQNVCWYTSSTRKTTDYQVWFEKMNQSGMNLSRVWMATWGFCLHWGKSYSDFSSRFSQAARLDMVMDYAEEYEIYFLLSLINHGQLSTMVNAEWDKNPYNVKNGGMLNNPIEFFTNAEAIKAYKNELMYLIARYSYSTNLLSWELFNEVDWIDGYSLGAQKVKSWHKEIGEFIKENDPFNHLVSTSYKGTDGNANSLEVIDFVSPHDYSYSSKNLITGVLDTITSLQTKYNKPVLFGEIGLSGENGYENYTQDKTGITLHQSQWAGIMAGGASGAMNWWWDSYVHPYNLYSNFEGIAKFSQLLDLSGSDYSLIGSNYSINNSNLKLMGYKFNNRSYGYIYDQSWTFYNKNIVNKTNVTVTLNDFTNGTYTLELYNTETGECINKSIITVTNNTLEFVIPSVQYDIAYIIK